MTDPDDPKGLVREAYAIAGITAPECRSILLDWALSLPLGADAAVAASALMRRHAVPDHPMSALLAEAAAAPGAARRRGGGRARARPPAA